VGGQFSKVKVEHVEGKQLNLKVNARLQNQMALLK
jgi:hypothetical protein